MSFTLLGILNAQAAGAGGNIYGFVVQDYGSLGSTFDNIAYTSNTGATNGDIYFSLTYNDGTWKQFFMQWDSSNSLLRRTALGGSFDYGRYLSNQASIAMPDGSVFLSYYDDSQGSTTKTIYHLDATQTKLWGKQIVDDPFDAVITVDGNKNTYLGSGNIGNYSQTPRIKKLDSSGNLTWFKAPQFSSINYHSGQTYALASNNNYVGYGVGQYNQNNGTYFTIIGSINASGSSTLNGKYTGGYNPIMTAGASHFYWVVPESGTDNLIVTKTPITQPWNQTWTTKLTMGATGDSNPGIKRAFLDADENLYVTYKAFNSGTVSTALHLAKFDSSGNLVWNRKFKSTSVNWKNNSFDASRVGFMTEYNSDNLLVTFKGENSTGNTEFVGALVVPKDGSGQASLSFTAPDLSTYEFDYEDAFHTTTTHSWTVAVQSTSLTTQSASYGNNTTYSVSNSTTFEHATIG